MRTLLALVGLLCAAVAGCGADSSEGGDEESSEAAYTPTASRHAIVLAHGFDASPDNRWGFRGVEERLVKDGHVVHTARVSPYKTVADRAVELAGEVEKAVGKCRARPDCDASKVHIIAHSMGGLDARYLIRKVEGYKTRVASLTTISTPHHGTLIADVLLGKIPSGFDGALDAIASAWALTFTDRDLAARSDVRGALESISTEGAASLAHELDLAKEGDDVTYLSWAGISGAPTSLDRDDCEGHIETRFGFVDALDASLAPAAWFVGDGLERIPNDGMVTVRSAKWGKFKGCIPADHLDEVGPPLLGTHLFTGFDHLDFYGRIAEGLDAEVAAHRSAR